MNKVSLVFTGANAIIISSLYDFDTPPKPVKPAHLQGKAFGLAVEGGNSAKYEFHADDSTLVEAYLHKLYVPAYPVCLFCPRHLSKNTGIPTYDFNSQQDNLVQQC
jgi:hypothetical protein